MNERGRKSDGRERRKGEWVRVGRESKPNKQNKTKQNIKRREWKKKEKQQGKKGRRTVQEHHGTCCMAQRGKPKWPVRRQRQIQKADEYLALCKGRPKCQKLKTKEAVIAGLSNGRITFLNV